MAAKQVISSNKAESIIIKEFDLVWTNIKEIIKKASSDSYLLCKYLTKLEPFVNMLVMNNHDKKETYIILQHLYDDKGTIMNLYNKLVNNKYCYQHSILIMQLFEHSFTRIYITKFDSSYITQILMSFKRLPIQIQKCRSQYAKIDKCNDNAMLIQITLTLLYALVIYQTNDIQLYFQTLDVIFTNLKQIKVKQYENMFDIYQIACTIKENRENDK